MLGKLREKGKEADAETIRRSDAVTERDQIPAPLSLTLSLFLLFLRGGRSGRSCAGTDEDL